MQNKLEDIDMPENFEDYDMPIADFFANTSVQYPHPFWVPQVRTFGGSETSSSQLSHHDSDFDDVISLSNFVSPEAYYSEDEDDCDDVSILHDIDVVGGGSDVLEVYIVEDDEDVADLPELEMGVDDAGFQIYYDDDETVDVEIPSLDVRCLFDQVASNLTTSTAELQSIFAATAPASKDTSTSKTAACNVANNIADDFDAGKLGFAPMQVMETEDGFTW